MFCQTPVVLRLTQASTVTADVAFRDAEDGTVTMSLTPSKEVAVLVSVASAPGCPSVTPFWYVPGFTPFSSSAVVPLASPRRQYAAGLSAMIAAR